MTDLLTKVSRAPTGRLLTGVSLAAVLAVAAAPALSQTVTSQGGFDSAVAAGIGQAGPVVIDVNSPNPGDDLPITLNNTLVLPGNASSFVLNFNSTGGTGSTGGFYIGDDGGTGSLTIGGATQININRDTHFNTLKVGRNGGDGTLIMTGGAITFSGAGPAGSFDIGRGAGAVGLFEQSGGTVTMANDAFQVGIVGAQGTANISGGTFNAGTTVRIGNGAGGDGTVNVSGTATFTQASGDFYIGETDSTGVFTQSGNSSVSLLSPRIGRGGTGTYQLDGGTLTAANLRLGETYSGGDGHGTFIQNGGQATFSNGIAFRWNNSNDASGAFIQNGGTTTISGGFITFGNATGTGTGSYTLGGSGILEVGGTGGLRGGKADDTFIFAGGTLRVTSTLTTTGGFVTELAEGTTSTIDTNGFNATWSSAIGGLGGFEKDGEGTLTLTAANTFTGAISILDGTLAITDPGAVGVANDVAIGASGTFDISGAGTPRTDVLIGALSGAGDIHLGNNQLITFIDEGITTAYSGTITSDNPGWVNPYGKFGKTGDGTLIIDGLTMSGGEFQVRGGTIAQTSGTTAIDYLTLGDGAGTSGTMEMSGGALDIGVGFAVGHFGGAGTMNQTGGAVTVEAGCDDPARCAALNIGNQGSTGIYNISGGTLHLVGGLHVVGRNTTQPASNGTLNISGDAVVELRPNADLDFGTGSLIIGNRDNATYDGGGAANQSSGLIQQDGGILRIVGASQLFLGGFGAGTYNLDGGALEIGGTSLQGLYGGGGNTTGTYAFNLGGGTIRVIEQDLVASVDATLVAGTNSTFDTNGLNATWNGVLTGGGGFTKAGEGTLVLGSDENDYEGTTIVEAGTLAAGVQGAFVDSIAYEINGGVLDVGSNGDLIMSALNGQPGGEIALGATDFGLQQFAANLTVDGGGVFGGSITGDGALTKLGEAILVLDGASSYTGGTALLGGELRVGDDDALGTGSLAIGDGTTLSFSDDVILANWIFSEGEGAFIIDTRGHDATLTGGIMAPDAVMAKTGTGTLLLSGGEFGPPSDLQTLAVPTGYELDLAIVEEGALLVDFETWLYSDVEILAGGTLGGNGTIVGDVFNAGTIGPGQSVGILDIAGNYAGGPLGSDLASGHFEVDLTAATPVAGVDYDQVRISGTATGATTIYLFQPNPNGPPTVLAGGTAALGDIDEIELMQIGVNEAEFALGHRVVQGGREVVLDIRDVANPDIGFFGDDLDFITVVGLAEGDIAAEVYGYAAATTAARQAGLAMLGSYVERRGLDGLLGDAPQGRVWARIAGAGYDSGKAGLDQDLWLGQAGIDLVTTAEGVRAGIMAGYGRSEGRFDSASGRGDLSGDLGMVGVYGNWTDGTAYAEAVMQYAFGEWRMTPAGLGRSTFDTETFGLSIEGGATVALTEDVSMLPWAQLAYQSIGFSGVRDPIGLDPDFENTDSLVLRGGVRAVAGFGGARLHGGLALAGELLGDAGVTVQGLQLDSDASGSWAELSAGVDLPLADGVALFAQFGYDRGLDGDLSVVRGHGGVRIGW